METKDQKDLKTLSTFHYIVGILQMLFSLFPLIHIVIGLGLAFFPSILGEDAPNKIPQFFGIFFAVIGSVFLITGEVLGLLTIYSGKLIARQQKLTFSIVIGCLNCLFFPFGTILGIFTIITLNKDSVKQLYQNQSSPNTSV